jgi:hypothetical protein
MKSKVFISVLVAVALVFSFGIAVKDAKADAILFPWITKGGTVATIVHVVNTANPVNTAIRTPGTLHYQYFFKRLTGDVTDQTKECEPKSDKHKTTKDDLVSFDAAGWIGGGYALFNDATDYNNLPFHLSGVSPDARAFLLVDNNIENVFTGQIVGGADVNASTNADGTLYGEAMMISIDEGATWGYIAYNAVGGVTTNEANPVSFSDGQDLLGEVIGSPWFDANPAWPDQESFGEISQTVFYNPNDMETKLALTPVSLPYQVDIPGGPFGTVVHQGLQGQRSGNINNAIQLCIQPAPSIADPNRCIEPGIWDNNEQPIDCSQKKDIVCTSIDTLYDIFAVNCSATYNDWVDDGVAAWSYVRVWPGTIGSQGGAFPATNPGSGMIIGKVEYKTNPDLGAIPTPPGAIQGTNNNMVWLRDNETLYGWDSFGIGPGQAAGTQWCDRALVLECLGGIDCIHNQTDEFSIQDCKNYSGGPWNPNNLSNNLTPD